MQNYAGVWLDGQQAIILKINGDKETEAYINAKLDSKNVKGGSRSSTPYGPQDAVSNSKIMERRKHQTQRYFVEIMDQIKGVDKVLLLGPGNTGGDLRQKMIEDYNFKNATVVTEVLDSITENQIKAKIRSFFK